MEKGIAIRGKKGDAVLRLEDGRIALLDRRGRESAKEGEVWWCQIVGTTRNGTPIARLIETARSRQEREERETQRLAAEFAAKWAANDQQKERWVAGKDLATLTYFYKHGEEAAARMLSTSFQTWIEMQAVREASAAFMKELAEALAAGPETPPPTPPKAPTVERPPAEIELFVIKDGSITQIFKYLPRTGEFARVDVIAPQGGGRPSLRTPKYMREPDEFRFTASEEAVRDAMKASWPTDAQEAWTKIREAREAEAAWAEYESKLEAYYASKLQWWRKSLRNRLSVSGWMVAEDGTVVQETEDGPVPVTFQNWEEVEEALR